MSTLNMQSGSSSASAKRALSFPGVRSAIFAICLAAGVACAADGPPAAKTTLAYPMVSNLTNVNFAGQVIGTSSRSVTVTFTGPYDLSNLTYNSVTAPPGFSLASGSCSVISTSACTIQVTFIPSAVGPVSGNVVFTYLFGIDGWSTSVPVSGTGLPSMVPHYYESILQRTPDASGQAYWIGELARVEQFPVNVNDVWLTMAMTFFESAEYAALAHDDAGFVTDLYNAFLDRAPDTTGLAYWTGQMAQGMTRDAVLTDFMFSTESAAYLSGIYGQSYTSTADIVADFYRGFLSRLPDDAGLAYWVSAFPILVCSGPSLYDSANAISAAFAGSGEYLGRNRTDTEYVVDLYDAFIGRGPDLAGLQYWVGQLESGSRTREDLRLAFLGSPEFAHRLGSIPVPASPCPVPPG